ERYSRNVGRPIGANEVSCSLSHRVAMQMLLDGGARHGIIFEDDFRIDDIPAFRALVENLVRHESAWDCVKLAGSRMPGAFRQLQLRDGFVLAAPLFKLTNSAGYMLSRRAAEIIRRNIVPIDAHYDYLLDRPWRFGLRYRIVRPFPVTQNLSIPST